MVCACSRVISMAVGNDSDTHATVGTTRHGVNVEVARRTVQALWAAHDQVCLTHASSLFSAGSTRFLNGKKPFLAWGQTAASQARSQNDQGRSPALSTSNT